MFKNNTVIILFILYARINVTRMIDGMSKYRSKAHMSRLYAALKIADKLFDSIRYFLFSDLNNGVSASLLPNKFRRENDDATMGNPDLSKSANVSIFL